MTVIKCRQTSLKDILPGISSIKRVVSVVDSLHGVGIVHLPAQTSEKKTMREVIASSCIKTIAFSKSKALIVNAAAKLNPLEKNIPS